MIFVGDVSISVDDHFVFTNVPEDLLSKSHKWCINLEGPVVYEPLDYGLYNAEHFIQVLHPFNITHAFLANNHIKDHPNGISLSIEFLKERAVIPVGIHSHPCFNLDQQSSVTGAFTEPDIILGFGSELIGCNGNPDEGGSSIKILKEDQIIQDLKEALSDAGGKKVFICFHANFELDRAPQPCHRDLSRRLIDIGASGVIFHHSHVVGFIETYKNRVICYGLGNWVASRGKFLGGELKYPEVCNQRIALEINGNNDRNFIHHFIFKGNGEISYEMSENVADKKCSVLAPFQNFSSTEYVKWYENNRRKSLFLPIFVGKDSTKLNIIKKNWVFLRQALIKTAVKIRLKKPTPSDVTSA